MSQESLSVPKILIIQPIHEDGMALFDARGDVAYEVVDGNSIEEMKTKIADADGVTIRTALLPGEVLEHARASESRFPPWGRL